ncbi:hypothetical protein HO133_002405 [Letharia lupina]|uniref:HPt domain-containing protein n=1 Tax=Letharia lupina TaxID=560253 RepID=A0A8H6CDS0_9LECA|nr:uncharacterized protein HO133_002405 [Letharia lupina]KAF6221549.1 hypothetical protein HO133_002405 [Letharia lupina]
MTKVSSIPKTAFPSTHSQPEEGSEGEEEDDMASHSTEDPSETGSTGLPDCGDSIDLPTFEQILEMDDDEDEREFSKSIVYGFFEQAEATFEKMIASLREQELATLSSLGHFLKGSSATLGMTKVKDSCEKIQHYGAHKDDAGQSTDMEDTVLLKKIKATVATVKVEYKEAERILKQFYHDPEH